jgi:DNA-binding MarR family transcriptional regulator
MKLKFPRDKHPVFAMKMVTDRADAVFAECVGTLRVTAPQCRLLMYLDSRNGEAVSQRELEHYLGVSHTTVKGLLKRLEEKGYVRTAFDSEDGRVKHAYLTGDFYRMQAQAKGALQDFETQLVAGFSADELETLRDMLERIYQNTLTAKSRTSPAENQ